MPYPNSLKTHCPRGHPYDAANTCVSGGSRFCLACARASQKARNAKPKQLPAASLMLKRIRRESDASCWVWTGRINDAGYGLYDHVRAHRIMYELFVGPIPEGLTIDHLCRNRSCVNPAHLEPVTRVENIKRGWRDRKRQTEQS